MQILKSILINNYMNSAVRSVVYNKGRKKRILFLCDTNSSLSQMAEGITKKYFHNEYEVFSAGINPLSLNAYAVIAMSAKGICIGKNRVKNINMFVNDWFDYIVAFSEDAKNHSYHIPCRARRMHKVFPDLTGVKKGGREMVNIFGALSDELKKWLINNL